MVSLDLLRGAELWLAPKSFEGRISGEGERFFTLAFFVKS